MSKRKKGSDSADFPKSKVAIKCRKRKRTVIASSFMTILVVLIIVLICKGCVGGKRDLSVLLGIWYYDQYTEYEFDGKKLTLVGGNGTAECGTVYELTLVN